MSVVALGLFFTVRYLLTDSVNTNLKPNSDIKVETSQKVLQVKEYKNTSLGISFEYPNKLLLNDLVEENRVYLSKPEAFGYFFEISLLNTNLSLEKFVSADTDYQTYYFTENTTFLNQDAVSLKHKFPGQVPMDSILIKTNKGIIKISYEANMVEGTDTEGMSEEQIENVERLYLTNTKPLIDQILSSIKLISE